MKSNLINNLKHFSPKLYVVPKDDEFELDFQYVFLNYGIEETQRTSGLTVKIRFSIFV